MFEKEIYKILKKELKEIPQLEVPPDSKLGDYALPCFTLAKEFKSSPKIVAEKLAKKLKPNKFIQKITNVGPYVNFFINKQILAEQILTKIHKDKNKYGSQKKKNKTIVMDFSHPNIAKPFGVHNIRSTYLGNALYKILTFSGYKCVGVNHLGDWGTQFGKLIYAYKTWGDKKDLDKEPINYLFKLYVKFHEHEEKDPSLKEKGQEWFKKLEEGDKEALKLWKLFRQESLKEFMKIYKVLNIKFDSFNGEAFYNDKMQKVITDFKKKKLTKQSEGALVVEVGIKDQPPLMLVKSNGTTTYATRDVTAALYRLKQYKAHKLLYVVDIAQELHFKQVFKALEKFGVDKSKLVHAPFGRLSFPEGKMSTRKGKVVFLEKVIQDVITKAEKIIQEKNPDLKNKKKVAKTIGVGALIFGDLINDRLNNIVFSIERALSFEGETAPYIQYTHARCCSILRKADMTPTTKVNYDQFNLDEEYNLVTLLSRFPEVVEHTAANYKPHILSRYLVALTQAFNEFYHKCPVISDMEDVMKCRLLLVDATRQVLKTGLNLLGIEAPKEM